VIGPSMAEPSPAHFCGRAGSAQWRGARHFRPATLAPRLSSQFTVSLEFSFELSGQFRVKQRTVRVVISSELSYSTDNLLTNCLFVVLSNKCKYLVVVQPWNTSSTITQPMGYWRHDPTLRTTRRGHQCWVKGRRGWC